MVRIIVDTRNAHRDYWLPRNEAHAQYMAGKLALCVNNTKPGEPVYIRR